MEIEAQAGAPETPEQFIARRDKAIHDWLQLRAVLESVKPQELEARNNITGIVFPEPKKGTNRFYLNNGYAIKLVHGTNYTLGDRDLVNTETQQKVPIAEQVAKVLNEIAEIDGQAAETLVKWKPELDEKVYLALEANSPIKKLIDSILTTKPATPQLTFEEPKK